MSVENSRPRPNGALGAALDHAGSEERQQEIARTRSLAAIIKAQVLAELPQHTAPKREGRGFGDVKTVAMRAAFVVFNDRVGNLPRSVAAMAAAISETATELGISPPDQPLDPTSRSVRDVAEQALAAQQTLDARDVTDRHVARSGRKPPR